MWAGGERERESERKAREREKREREARERGERETTGYEPLDLDTFIACIGVVRFGVMVSGFGFGLSGEFQGFRISGFRFRVSIFGVTVQGLCCGSAVSFCMVA